MSSIKLPFLYIALSFCFILFTEGECNPAITPSFKVTFDTDGGSAVAAQDIVQGAKATKPTADPMKDGYTFLGWYKADKATAFSFATETITAATTIFAKWEQTAATSFTVTFNTDGGAAIAAVSVASGGNVAKPTDPTKDGYTFLGWYKADKATAFNFATETITAATTIFAKWEQTAATSFTVTFNTDGGSAIASANVESGGKVTKPADPTRAGYTFLGWYKDSDKQTAFNFATETITAATTIYAKWEAAASTEAQLLSFSFAHATNEGLLDVSNADISGTVDENAKTVSVTASPYVQLEKLKASFTISAGASVNIGGENQSTGETVNDFSSDITYEVVAADGVTKQRYVVTITKSNLATIPDANFLAKLKAQFANAFTNDLLDITHSDVTGFAGKIDVSRASIASLKGIEFFTRVTDLRCHINQLQNLDVSKNTALTTLWCYDNELKSLDVSKNTALRELYCNSNELTSLDVSKNTSLQILRCEDNQLTSLDMRGVRLGFLSIVNASPADRTNALTSLKVHDDLKDCSDVKALKAAFGSSLSISTYSAAAGSSTYILTCSDYNPNEAEGSRCQDSD